MALGKMTRRIKNSSCESLYRRLAVWSRILVPIPAIHAPPVVQVAMQVIILASIAHVIIIWLLVVATTVVHVIPMLVVVAVRVIHTATWLAVVAALVIHAASWS